MGEAKRRGPLSRPTGRDELMSEATRPPGDQPPPEPTLKWHVCPVCGLAGWAREGFGYCRLHRERAATPFAGREKREEGTLTSPDGRPLTMIEIVLGRIILKAPPGLHDRIQRFGGYSKITAEGWDEYDAAMAEYRDKGRT
jgi:hypothetical protein